MEVIEEKRILYEVENNQKLQFESYPKIRRNFVETKS